MRDMFCESVAEIETLAVQGRALRLLAHTGKTGTPRIGAMKGKFVLPEDFDSPLPDAMLDTFEENQT
ncbi:MULTISPECIES: type II toxin-antitoxin system prevent-host-death family antitoxin [unclassified Pseudomonas]|uniref:type II toxin-antitoxin system prevent-host-death family antitoxin n=1 Tax=unclassified Pseudomonas TaxID=196821 RepID=UPI001FFEFB63|nr:type II toxin-antitoxin system prevent-host-death family antitoxin [Pseudomonas sp. MWU12-2020]